MPPTSFHQHIAGLLLTDEKSALALHRSFLRRESDVYANSIFPILLVPRGMGQLSEVVVAGSKHSFVVEDPWLIREDDGVFLRVQRLVLSSLDANGAHLQALPIEARQSMQCPPPHSCSSVMAPQ